MPGFATPTILLVEDSPAQARLVRQALREHFGEDRVVHVATCADADAADLTAIDMVLSDLHLPDGTGMDLLPRLLDRRCGLPIVILTAEDSYDVALEAIRRGAYDYVVKTGDYQAALPVIVEKNLAIWRTKRENNRLQEQLTHTLTDLRRKNEQLESAVAQLRTMVTTDPLTNLANRRAFNDALERLFNESMRYGGDLSCVMIDLDRFKAYNDARGHQAGDDLLRRAGRVLKANCRASDVAARFGGDEFVLLLPQTDAQTAAHACRRIAGEFHVVTADLGDTVCTFSGVTMSMGVASLAASRPGGPSQLISFADQALYSAKATRRGEIVVFDTQAVGSRQ